MLRKLILILLFSVTLSSCNSNMSPEEEIKEYLTRVENHFEDRQATKLKKYISEEYLDDYGNTKSDVIRFAAGYILRRPTIYISSNIKEMIISENNNKARVKIDVAVSTTPLDNNDIRLTQGEFHRFIITLERTKGWQLHSLQWQKTTIDEYLDDTT